MLLATIIQLDESYETNYNFHFNKYHDGATVFWINWIDLKNENELDHELEHMCILCITFAAERMCVVRRLACGMLPIRRYVRHASHRMIFQ